MRQHVVASKIVAELWTLGLADEKDHELLHTYIMWAYAVGYDAGSKSRSNKKPVSQYDLDGHLIEIYESAAAASRATKIAHSDIAKCASGYKHPNYTVHTAGGFRWIYVDLTDPDAFPKATIGRLPEQIDRQVRGIRASRISSLHKPPSPQS